MTQGLGQALHHPQEIVARTTLNLYCSPVLRHPAGLIQAANFRSAIAF